VKKARHSECDQQLFDDIQHRARNECIPWTLCERCDERGIVRTLVTGSRPARWTVERCPICCGYGWMAHVNLDEMSVPRLARLFGFGARTHD
jgi:hypothetical protein